MNNLIERLEYYDNGECDETVVLDAIDRIKELEGMYKAAVAIPQNEGVDGGFAAHSATMSKLIMAQNIIKKLQVLLQSVTATAKNRKDKIEELTDEILDLESEINWRIDNEDNTN